MSTAPSSLPRPLDWLTWVLWVAACATAAVLSAKAATAFDGLLDAAPLAVLFGGPFLLLTLPIMGAGPALLQWVVLRRSAPHLRWWVWLAATGFAWGTAAALEISGTGVLRARREFAFAVGTLPTRWEPDVTLEQIIGLPWAQVLAATVATTLVTLLLPCWVFSRAARIRFPVVLTAVVAGACAETALAQVYLLNGLSRFLPGLGEVPGSASWSDSTGELFLRAATGATWGATSGLVIAQFVRSGEPRSRASGLAAQGRGGLAVMLGTTLLIALLAPVLAICVVPYRAEAALNSLRRAFTFAPSEDRSEGEALIRYSHPVRVKPLRYGTVLFAPDSRSFLMVTAEDRLARIDVSTGELQGFIDDRTGRSAFRDEAWSPDGRYLALRTNGGEVATSDGRYKRAVVRVRILAAPGYGVAGEYIHPEGECLNEVSTRPSLMFEDGGKALWVVCGHDYSPSHDTVLALRLEVPSMRVLEMRRFGDRVADGTVYGIASVGSSIWYWQQSATAPPRLLIRDLTHDRDVFRIGDLDRILQSDDFSPGGVQLGPDRVRIGYGMGVQQQGTYRNGWLVFDIHSGNLLEKKEQPGPPKGVTRTGMDLRNDLSIETTYRDASRAGDLEVFDRVSGRRRQHLSTPAQTLAGVSPDGRWVVMNAFDRRVLRIYRVEP